MKIPKTMRAMLFERVGQPLRLVDLPVPNPGPLQVLLKVHACGVCHTDLHIQDGELNEPALPLVLGHQIIGTVIGLGSSASRFQIGARVGVPWLGAADGTCPACHRGQENLCDHPTFTGYHVNGGFAEFTVADERFCFPIPAGYDHASAAPLLCAGLIGYRTYRMAGENIETLGIYGFGAAGHLVAQLAKYEGNKVYAFTRPGDSAAQQFALAHGADWAGDSTSQPPEKLDAALIFAPVGDLVVEALRATRKGGTVVCGGIHMSDIPAFPYSLLWEERCVRSVANLTRQDGEQFFAIASHMKIQADLHIFPLESAQQALDQSRAGELTGAAVLLID